MPKTTAVFIASSNGGKIQVSTIQVTLMSTSKYPENTSKRTERLTNSQVHRVTHWTQLHAHVRSQEYIADLCLKSQVSGLKGSGLSSQIWVRWNTSPDPTDPNPRSGPEPLTLGPVRCSVRNFDGSVRLRVSFSSRQHPWLTAAESMVNIHIHIYGISQALHPWSLIYYPSRVI